MRAGRAGRARQASVSGRGAQGARGVQASGRVCAGGRAGGRRAGARGAQAGRRQRARQAQAWARGAGRERSERAAWVRGARGVGVPVRAGLACWLVSWASFGAQCTWLSFDSVFGPVRLGIFLSHLMNTVHCKINFRKKNIY